MPDEKKRRAPRAITPLLEPALTGPEAITLQSQPVSDKIRKRCGGQELASFGKVAGEDTHYFIDGCAPGTV
jgi:hypothetical protein